MSFFSRVLNHLVNELLVEKLANSRTFQRFAVRSNSWMQDAGKKTAEQQVKLEQQAKEWLRAWREHPGEEAPKATKRFPRKD